MLQVVARWHSGALAKAFAGWRSRVGSSAAKALSQEKAALLWINMALAKAWHSWRVGGRLLWPWKVWSCTWNACTWNACTWNACTWNACTAMVLVGSAGSSCQIAQPLG